MACDGCGSVEATPVLVTRDRRYGGPGRFSVERCAGCGLARTAPVPGDLAAYYPDGDYYAYRPPRPPTGRARRRVRRAYALDRPRSRAGQALGALAAFGRDRLAPGLPPGPPGDVLDVGCGSGAFLLALREAGWRPHGIELSADAVAAARTAGLEGVRAGDLVDAGYPAASFDAVRFWHSLEHTRSPRAQLEAARRALRPGGTLTVGVPNLGSLLARVARGRWYPLDVPRHLWHFEPDTLARLVASCGFRVTRTRTVSGGTALLGTIDHCLPGGRGRLADSRWAWYAALPAAALLDGANRGDALELTATAA